MPPVETIAELKDQRNALRKIQKAAIKQNQVADLLQSAGHDLGEERIRFARLLPEIRAAIADIGHTLKLAENGQYSDDQAQQVCHETVEAVDNLQTTLDDIYIPKLAHIRAAERYNAW